MYSHSPSSHTHAGWKWPLKAHITQYLFPGHVLVILPLCSPLLDPLHILPNPECRAKPETTLPTAASPVTKERNILTSHILTAAQQAICLIWRQGALLGYLQPSCLLTSFGIHGNTHIHISWSTSHTVTAQCPPKQAVSCSSQSASHFAFSYWILWTWCWPNPQVYPSGFRFSHFMRSVAPPNLVPSIHLGETHCVSPSLQIKMSSDLDLSIKPLVLRSLPGASWMSALLSPGVQPKVVPSAFTLPNNLFYQTVSAVSERPFPTGRMWQFSIIPCDSSFSLTSMRRCRWQEKQI